MENKRRAPGEAASDSNQNNQNNHLKREDVVDAVEP